MNNNVKMVAAFVAGAAVGTMLGVLFAPEKGTAIRKKVSEEGEKLAGALSGTDCNKRTAPIKWKEDEQAMINGNE